VRRGMEGMGLMVLFGSLCRGCVGKPPALLRKTTPFHYGSAANFDPPSNHQKHSAKQAWNQRLSSSWGEGKVGKSAGSNCCHRAGEFRRPHVAAFCITESKRIGSRDRRVMMTWTPSFTVSYPCASVMLCTRCVLDLAAKRTQHPDFPSQMFTALDELNKSTAPDSPTLHNNFHPFPS